MNNREFNVGDKFVTEIIDLTSEGKGIAKIEGFTVFVDGGLPGDKGKIEITKIKKNFGLGKMVELTFPSVNRVKPKCRLSGICGGCQLQELDYTKQLKIKTDIVKNNIERIGKLKDIKINDTIGMKQPYRYRNKAQFQVGKKGKDIAIGFYQIESHDIINVDKCILQNDINDKIIDIVRKYMKDFKIKPYDRKSKKGIIRHILTRVSSYTGEIMVIIVTKTDILPYSNEFIHLLIGKIPQITSIIQNVNKKNSSEILGMKNKVLFGNDRITDSIGNLKFSISPMSFYQVNPTQTQVLYNKALDYAHLVGNEVVFDIYCGIGTISLFLAQRAKKVYGIEIVKEAIKDARINAKLNNINNVEFYDGKAEDILPNLYKDGIKADVIVVDPPRKGCHKSVIEMIIKMRPKKVIYVSCNPSTLARDLKYLDEGGYKAVEVQPVDMFPQTGHVECVVLISRVDK